MYIIKDWIGNILDYEGYFNLSHFVVQKTFNSFNDAEDWLVDNLLDYEENKQDIYIEGITICKTY